MEGIVKSMTNARLILVPTAALIAGLMTAAVGVMGYSAVRQEHPGRTGDPGRQTRETGAASLVGQGPPRPTAARPAADQHPVTLEVDVVDPAGRRLAGVDVAVVARYSRKSAPNESVLKRTKTNGVERIRMDLARETPDATVYYASVWAYQPGRALDTSSVRITGPAGSPSVQLVLSEPAQRTITVLGPDDRPMPGLRLTPHLLQGTTRTPLAVPDGC